MRIPNLIVSRRIALLLPATLGFSTLPRQANAQKISDIETVLSRVHTLFQEFLLREPDNLLDYFYALWRLKTSISLATVGKGVDQELEDLLAKARTRIQDDAGDDIDVELSLTIKQNTARLQNIIICQGTEAKNKENLGNVTIDRETVRNSVQWVCPLYPFC